MAERPERKQYPMSMRLPEEDIAIIDRAATLHGRSRTEFVRDAAVRAAESALLETMPIRLGESGFEVFLAVVAGPGQVVPELVETLRRPAPWKLGR